MLCPAQERHENKMELEESNHSSKRFRVVVNGSQTAKIGRKEHRKDDEEDRERKGRRGDDASGTGPWEPHLSSRIFRVSRASGGKDRHSKVYTARGLRDRRVRLSVSTAIQFYDLQDRLGYDQPSKAIEWLIKAAAAAINELPPLDGFPKPPYPTRVETMKANPDTESSHNQQQQHMSTKSGCSSTSETSKGSVLSLSRSESRIKARERARERAAKDKSKYRDDGGHHVVSRHQNLNHSLNPQTSFTELLTGSGGGGVSNNANATTVAAGEENTGRNCIARQIPTADYFVQAGLFTQPRESHQHPPTFSSQSHFGNSSPMGLLPFNITATSDHPEMQQLFLQDNLFPISAVAATGDYNLSFSISSGIAGFSRGTLQSNSPAQLPQQHHHNDNHLPRLSSTVDGSNLQFFGAAAGSAAAAGAENQYPAECDGRLQLCYGGDGYRHSELKGKGKS
ncbi:hypothetical protein BHE74_00019493 [Ensete ventricosum]|nr:hypothetical protein BHE74_00019493 [Ensete ventricosum]